MALDLPQQIKEAVDKSKHILITFRKEYNLDSLSSAIAFFLILKKMNKLADVACADFSLPRQFSFLPAAKIEPEMPELQKLIISLDLSKNKIGQLSYENNEDKLDIFVEAKLGKFKSDDVKILFSGYKYDLIIILDTPDLESLGELFEKNREFVFDTPKINIDHNPGNERFGQINAVSMTAAATSEIVFEIINAIDRSIIDKDIATCLLTGLIYKTRSFKTQNVTPKTLNVASQLISEEADRDAIVKKLFQSKSMATLKLWGRVLARLKGDMEKKFVWSAISEHDFLEAEASEEDVNGVIEELISSIPGIEAAAILLQRKNDVHVILESQKNMNSLLLLKQFNPLGSKYSARVTLKNISLIEAEKNIIQSIKQNIDKLPK